MLVFAAIVPHPPESIPGIGEKEDYKAIEKTLKSFESLRLDLEKADPNTLIIISPHGHLDYYSFTINSASQLVGSFEKFGLEGAYSYENNIEFSDKLAYCASLNELSTHLHEDFLDHGAMIPLFHLVKNIKPKIVHLSFSLMNYDVHYRYGELIQSLINKGLGGRVAVVASADLSHRLTPDAPAGYSPTAENFDKNILHYLGSNDARSILELKEDVSREAAECGVRSILILLGILHGMPHKFELLSYERPLGIGYMTAKFF